MRPSVTRFFYGAFALLCIYIIARISYCEIQSPDLFWHLRMGLDFIERGVSPFVDHNSYTMFNQPIRDLGWLFQVIISYFYKFFGLAGVCTYRFICWLLGLFLLHRVFEKENISFWRRGLWFSFYLFALIYRPEPRPELLSLPLELLTVLLLQRWLADRKWLSTIILFCLFVFWANYHVSSVIGYVILGSFAIVRFIQDLLKKDREGLKFTVLSTCVIIAAGFLRYDLTHPLIANLHLTSEWFKYIEEYEPRSLSNYELPLRLYMVLLLISLPALLQPKMRYGLVVILVLALRTLGMYKLFPHLIVISLPFVSMSFEFYIAKMNENNLRASRLTQGALALIFALAIFCDVRWAIWRPFFANQIAVEKTSVPVYEMEYANSHNLSGRVLNDYAAGGYIMFKTGNRMPVYIDGRTNILYPLSNMQRFIEVSTNVKEMLKEKEKYNFEFVIARTDPVYDIIFTALESHVFSIDYMGPTYALLVQGKSNFPLTSKYFLHPECLRDDDLDKFAGEYKLAQDILVEKSPLRQFLTLVNAYNVSKTKNELFAEANPNLTTSSPVLRLAAILAGRQHQEKTQLEYLLMMPNPWPEEMIRAAELDCQFHDCEIAEERMQGLRNHTWTDNQVFRVHDLVTKYKAFTSLSDISLELIRHTRGSFEKWSKGLASVPPLDYCGKD